MILIKFQTNCFKLGKSKFIFEHLCAFAVITNAILYCRAVEIILKKKPQMANDKMSDGIAALHLAAVNNCIEIANILIKSVSTLWLTNRSNIDMKKYSGRRSRKEKLFINEREREFLNFKCLKYKFFIPGSV